MDQNSYNYVKNLAPRNNESYLRGAYGTSSSENSLPEVKKVEQAINNEKF